MKKATFANTLITLSASQLFFQAGLLAAEGECCETPCSNLAVLPGDPINPDCINAGYLLPAGIKTACSWNFYARGDFIYFAYSQEVTPPDAQRFTFVDGVNFQVQRTTKNLLHSAPYRPGFRVSAGVDLDAVILDATYMRYHSTVTNNFGAGNNAGLALVTAAGGILASNPVTGQPTLFATIRSARTISVDRLLVTAQRPVYMGSRLIMDLNFGILGYWNQQKWRFDTTALGAPPVGVLTSNGFASANHKGWAVGPDLGFKAMALFPWHFHAIFNVDLSLLYGYCTHGRVVNSFPQAPLATNNTTLIREKAGFTQAVQSAEIGIGWGDYFCCDKYHVDLYVTYNFISQYLITEGIPYSQTAMDPYFFAYSLQGLAIGGQINF
ncbi:MAG: hypothetical protein JSS30_02695 [Verrucomicrobia bacterium]|nr:hypothetical protein [Verrucomicrobiota bacterium]